MARTRSFDEHLEQYEGWFSANKLAYESEVLALQQMIPPGTDSVEIGVGSGLFAIPLGITIGVEPSVAMRHRAQERGMTVYDGVAEALPLDDESFDVALMVTTICFVDDILASFREAQRILRPGGALVVGFVDADSPIGQLYQQYKDEDVFYRDATFYSTPQVEEALEQTGFQNIQWTQTLFLALDQITAVEQPRGGYGEGSFVVARAYKPK
jgi:ubiquinone/menaquinone biosynthesis C-methylase UbiE